MSTRSQKQYTLILPLDLQRRRILLGMKLRGFGVHKYNGFGGKIEPGETPHDGALRELHEESFLHAVPESTHSTGSLLLRTHADTAALDLYIHVFIATEWTGEPVETDEMRPEWFDVDSLPLEDMWEETTSWMPGLLKRWVDGKRASVGHCVGFNGGMDKGTKEWSVWHGMGGGKIRWWDEEWSDDEWRLLVKEWEEEGAGVMVRN
ncbi:hypothetical protein EX30DRAFT_302665 [Ascodesmis nigricans]|uniref:Oxidized purine nucleoside triphosphate hydrolase n=1 Tax=Ascodesmis nigricans TaxID=341454 RepID=A0A4S2N2P9_9PEZI|nr:hypothetical protein EX30DRAFT_302665 [Ascodesmis nigricans]